MSISAHNSNIISFLRFTLTFAVVMQHSMGKIETDIHWDNLTGMDIYFLIKALCSGCIALIAVPVFFFISGYLFFANIQVLDRNTYVHKMRSRVKSLLLPYLTWNILCIPLVIAVMYGETLSGTRPLAEFTAFLHQSRWTHIFWDFTSKESNPYDNLFGLSLLNSSPLLGTFWYIRDLFIISILSPVVYWYIKKTGWYGFWLLVILYVLKIWPYIILSHQSLFFVFGAYLSLNRKDLFITNKIIRYGTYSLIIILLFILLRLMGNATHYGAQLSPAFTFVGCFALLSFTSTILSWKPGLPSLIPTILTKSCFFIYALHIKFALPLGFFILKNLFRHTNHPLLLSVQYLFTPILIYAICIASYMTLQKLTPRMAVLLNGNR